ncbi:hypothetical protein C1645_736712 [Glomus cerebriforme]|uniref:SAM domain-containing protein n=1 Tax=Glomus cerebriforme TaxID=658196 RepID=A0A397T6H5_9GLOM|nr:hypothetical protein C1645_736712 [Glomus cerebriforme]
MSFPAIDEIKKWDTKTLTEYLEKLNLNIDKRHVKTLEKQEVTGETFLDLTQDDLKIMPLGPAKVFTKIINKLKGENQGKPLSRNNWSDLSLLNKTIEADRVHTQESASSTAFSTNEKDKITYKTLPSWQKTRYDGLTDERLKVLYLETIREQREKNELNLDIVKVALVSLVNIPIDVLSEKHNDDESIKKFILILNVVVYGIPLLAIILKIVGIVALGILFSVLLGLFTILPNIAIYWVDAGLLCSELHLKISAQQNV